jgi:hypothetical protein
LDSEEEILASLGIFCTSEIHLEDLKKLLTQYASDRNFQVTHPHHKPSSHASLHPYPNPNKPYISPLVICRSKGSLYELCVLVPVNLTGFLSRITPHSS